MRLPAKAFADGYKRPAKGYNKSTKRPKLLKISHNLAVRMKFAAKIRKNINSTKFLTKNNTKILIFYGYIV